MTNEPPVDRSTLLKALKSGYGLEASSLEFLPLGSDARSFSYRCTADGSSYYVKLRRATGAEARAFSVAVFAMHHVQGAISPLRTHRDDRPWFPVGEFQLSLFPFVEGVSGWDVEPADGPAAKVRTILHEQRAVIQTVIADAYTLAESFRQQTWEPVVCHGDFHSGNFLVAPSGELHPLDWDTLVWAPRERDLMLDQPALAANFLPRERRWTWR